MQNSVIKVHKSKPKLLMIGSYGHFELGFKKEALEKLEYTQF